MNTKQVNKIHSEQSDDSDLIGIEDLPQFRNDYFPPADNDSVQDMFNEKVSKKQCHFVCKIL